MVTGRPAASNVAAAAAVHREGLGKEREGKGGRAGEQQELTSNVDMRTARPEEGRRRGGGARPRWPEAGMSGPIRATGGIPARESRRGDRGEVGGANDIVGWARGGRR